MSLLNLCHMTVIVVSMIDRVLGIILIAVGIADYSDCPRSVYCLHICLPELPSCYIDDIELSIKM